METDHFYSVVPSLTSSLEFENYLPTSPVLSSRDLHWEHLMVRSYQEPSKLDETFFPAGPDIYLVLMTGGAVQIEERKPHGPWVSYVVRQGDWFLSPAAGEPYALRWRSLSETPVSTLHLHLNSTFFHKNALKLHDADPTRVKVREMTGFQDALLLNLGLCLQQEVQNQNPLANRKLSEVYAESAAYMLAAHLLRQYCDLRGSQTASPSSKRAGNLSSVQLNDIKEFVAANLNHNLSLEVLSDLIGFSPYHFARLFRDTTGLSPHRFVLEQRLKVATRLLTQSNLSLAEIALEVGFPNQSHFSQVFKRHTGLTPGAYARQMRYRNFSINPARFR